MSNFSLRDVAHSYNENLKSRLIGLIQADKSACAAADKYKISYSTSARLRKQFHQIESYSPKSKGNKP